MDRQLRKEIRDDVMAAMQTAMMQMDERWISAQELCNQFQMFSQKWLKYYGDVLPRRRVTVTGLDGVKHTSHWAYPQHEIAMNIANGLYDDMKIFR